MLAHLYTKKKNQLLQKADPFFTTKYFDPENVVERFLNFCQENAPQTKTIVALSQSTLSGKTRLIIESSYRYPIIMISFKKSNTCYNKIVSSFRNEPSATTFVEALLRNRIIFLKIRLLFISYMQFMDCFKTLVGKAKWSEIEELDKKVFNVLLLSNEGNKLVYELYEQNIKQFGVEELNVENIRDENFYKNNKAKIHSAHEKLFFKLEKVYFALDECHVPLQELKGVLFHSDYKTYSENDVFTWSQFEQSTTNTTSSRIIPCSDSKYPYLQPSSLFTVFQFLLQEYLTQFNQVTLFVSTFYSPIIDRPLYTKDKVDIIQWTELPLLTKEYMREQLDELEVSKENRIKYAMNELIEDLVGRPGLFYEWCYLHLQPTIKSYSSIDINIQHRVDGLLRHVQQNSTIMKQLYFISLFNNFNMQVLSLNDMESVLKAGVGNKSTTTTITIEGVIKKRILNTSSAMSTVEMQRIMNEVLGKTPEQLGEVAATYSILQEDGNELSVFLKQWKSETEVSDAINRFRINAKYAYFVNDVIEKADVVTNVFKEKFWDSIVGSRTGLRMPDLMFSCNYETSKCLVTVQMKIHSNKLSQLEFDNAISSISVDKMFQGHDQTHEKFTSILHSWRETYDISFVRILVCFAGFTKNQVQMVNAFNRTHTSQPILLVHAGKADVGHNVFGELCYKLISERTSVPREQASKSKSSKTEAQRNNMFNPSWVLFPNEVEAGPSNEVNNSTYSSGTKRKDKQTQELDAKRKKLE